MDMLNVPIADEIRAENPAGIWSEGYPIGNGRLGGMVLGDHLCERVSLNHDRLWRRYWKYHDKHLQDVFPEYQRLCLEKKFNEAIELIRHRLMEDGYYVNPFVPVGDLGIYPAHPDGVKLTDYIRRLDMSSGLVEVSYFADGTKFRREYLASWPAEVIAVNLASDRPGGISGEYSLYRIPDVECTLAAKVLDNQLLLEGCFDEGVKFVAAVRVIAKGGEVIPGLTQYVQPEGPVAQKNTNFAFGFRECPHPQRACGISLKARNADELTLLVSMTTDRIASGDLVEYCLARLDAAGDDYGKIKAEHIADHRELYDRVSVRLSEKNAPGETSPQMVERVRDTGIAGADMLEKLFKLGRYLAIASGRPAHAGEPFKAPINLQGLWNEDPRPAWDSDYHLDLNLQMCYWGLGQVNMAELGASLVDWAWNLLPQARHAAADLYGLDGAFYTIFCDAENLGNSDALFMLASGTNAWLAQSLWQVWEYSGDEQQFYEKIYPIVREIGLFYQGLLNEDPQGRLVTAPSGSPENAPKNLSVYTVLSEMSTFDVELLRELFGNLIEAAVNRGEAAEDIETWKAILEKLPMPTINAQGRLLEWLESDYETHDPGHRHRSHLVGICPGRRITCEDAPRYVRAVEKALELRQSFGGKGSCTLDLAIDAQIYARMYEPEKSHRKICDIVANHAMGNLMMCLCNWRPDSGLRWFGDRRVFQIESSFGTMAAISEMMLQDMGGLIRLLPALPKECPSGEVKGLCCRGGFVVDIIWRNDVLHEAGIESRWGNTCRVKSLTTKNEITVQADGLPVKSTFKDGIVSFATKKGVRYVLKDKR